MVSITPEQLAALAESDDHCVRIRDPKTNKTYLLLEQDELPETDAEHIEYMRRGLDVAKQEIADGKGQPWDRDAIRIAGERMLEQRQRRPS